MELFYGQAQTLTSWSLGTDAVVRTASAPTVTGATRLYGIVEGKLAYVEERATTDHELQPHTSALLAGPPLIGRPASGCAAPPGVPPGRSRTEPRQPASAADTTSRASACTCSRCSGPLNDSA